MPSLAIAAFGVQLRVGNGTPLAPLTVTAATNATPIVIETAIPHGIVDVSHGTVAGVTGNLGANGSWVLERTDATHLKLRGSVGTGAYTSGGTVVIDSTYTPVAEVTNIEDLGATAQTVDVTAPSQPPQPPVPSHPFCPCPAARGAAGTPWWGARQGGRRAWCGPTPGAGTSGSRVAWGGRTRSVEKAV